MAFTSPYGALPALQALQALHLLGGQPGLDSAPSPYAPQAALLQLLSGAQHGAGAPGAGLLQMGSAPHHHQTAATNSGGSGAGTSSDVMHEPGDRRPSSENGEPAATRRRTSHQPALSDPQDEPSKHGRGASASKQEKNRQAQRRFRERQKNMIEDLKHWVDTLSKQVADKDRVIATLRDENIALRHKLGAGEHAMGGQRQEQSEAQVQAEASALLMLAQGAPQGGMRGHA